MTARDPYQRDCNSVPWRRRWLPLSMLGVIILWGLFILFILPTLVMVVEGSDE